MLFSAAMCQFAFVLLAIKRKAPFLLDRPRLHPNACLVAFIEYPATHFFVALHRRMFRQARNCVDTGEQKHGISKPLPKSKAHVREQGGIFAHELYQLRMRRFEFFDGFL